MKKQKDYNKSHKRSARRLVVFIFMKVGEGMNFIVNNHIWRLQFVNPKSNHLLRSNMTRTIGVSDNNLKTVFIADNLSDYMLDRVICHELVHVFSFENDCSYDIETEEVIANFLSLFGRDIIYLADKLIGNILRKIA